MRAFRVSLVIFTLMLALIAVSTAYGRRVCCELEERVAQASDAPAALAVTQTEALLAYWHRQTPYLRPLINRTVVRTVSDLVGDLAVYADPTLDAAPEYRATRERLLGAIDEMRRAERASFGLWS